MLFFSERNTTVKVQWQSATQF